METTITMKPETLDGLKDLVRINLDSAEGLRTAAERLEKHPPVASLFRLLAQERSGFETELRSYVQLNAEEVTSETSWQSKVHRWWLELRADVSKGDLKAVLEEAERGEDKIKATYEDVMRDNVGNPVSDVLHRQYAQVKKAHDRIRNLRDKQ